MAKDKKFKPHMMYCKDGSVKEAKTFKDHLKFKSEGCGHKKPKDKAMAMEPGGNDFPPPPKGGLDKPKKKK